MSLPEQNASKAEVEAYYNQFKEHQKTLGINIRHRTIFKNLKRAGLKEDMNVLEIGCGIGTVSHLILKFLKKGRFVGVDISPESIASARQFNAAFKNAEFMVSDMSDFKHPLCFDAVVLPDVLEHIPVEQHKALFTVLKAHTRPGSLVLINIPEPRCLNWLRSKHPEKLQIIDQSLSLQDLLNNCYPADFELCSVEPYALQYIQNDYLSILLKRNQQLQNYTLKSKLQLGKSELLSKL